MPLLAGTIPFNLYGKMLYKYFTLKTMNISIDFLSHKHTKYVLVHIPLLFLSIMLLNNQLSKYVQYKCFFIFSVRLYSVLCGHSVFSSPPQRPMNSDFEGFLYQILSITLFSYLNS